MKIVVRVALLILLVIGGLLLIYRLAAERVEVVELYTVDDLGETVITRLWIVDHDGSPYLRASGESSGWYTRLHTNGQFEINRNGQTITYTAQDRVDKTAVVNKLMQEKYTWGDSFVGFFMGSRENSIAIELKQL